VDGLICDDLHGNEGTILWAEVSGSTRRSGAWTSAATDMSISMLGGRREWLR
jgi:hypothetical protein